MKMRQRATAVHSVSRGGENPKIRSIEYALWAAFVEALIMINCRGSSLIMEIDRQAWSGG
jgi:hypothetical protein